MATKYKYGGHYVTYASKGMSGTSATAKKFEKSGIESAKKNDTCINPNTGHVYKCTTAGKPKDAKWKYVGTAIIENPDTPVKSLTIKRRAKGSRVFDVTWKVPKKLTESTNCKRAQGYLVVWEFHKPNSGRAFGEYLFDVNKRKGASADSDAENLDSFSVSGTTVERKSEFYPAKGKTMVEKIIVTVMPYNSVNTGAWREATYKFKPPRDPSISGFSFDKTTGVVSCKITPGTSDDACERYDTWWSREVVEHRSGQEDARSVESKTFTGSDKTVGFDASGYQSLGTDDWYRVTVKAKSRGLMGDSGVVSRTYYVSRPKRVTIKTDKKPGGHVECTSRDSSGRVTVPIQVYPNGVNTTVFPVDHIRLQALADVAYAKASDIPANAEWKDVSAEDNAACTALTCAVADVAPSVGSHSWLRVKAWHAHEDALFSFSNVVEVPLHVKAPTAADDKCEVLSCVPGPDGTSMEVIVGYDLVSSSADDDATGTQFGWSNDADAWRSTEQPSTFDVADAEWDRETIPSGDTGHGTWRYRHRLVVRGLAEGESYHFRARRYMEGEDATTYGRWCNPMVAQTTTTPPSVSLTAPTGIERGAGLDLAWVLASLSTQTRWEVRKPSFAKTADTAIVTGKTYYTLSNGAYAKVANPVAAQLASYYERQDVILAEGDDASGATTVPWERIEEHADGDRITVCVDCSTGSNPVESEWRDVAIADRPTLMVYAPTLTAQPAILTVESETYPLDVAWSVLAATDSSTGPDGTTEQYAGDVVAGGLESMTLAQVAWSDSLLHAEYAERLTDAQAALTAAQEVLDELEEGDEGYDEAVEAVSVATDEVAMATALESTSQVRYQGTIQLEVGRVFHDKSDYEVRATPTDRTTDLTGDAATCTFAVDWTHKAPQPATETWALTEDESIVEGHTYYTYDAEEDEYEEVAEPDASELSTYYVPSPGITVTPYVTEDDNGSVRRGCTIALVPPAHAASTDVYDVYRVTHDGAQLVSQPQGHALDATLDDSYAPFGDAGDYAYRVACRTADGDVEWRDYDYYADAGVLKLDFGGLTVELPYNLAIGDSYSKDVEIRAHMDGMVEAYHNPTVRRKATLSTDVMRVEDAETAALVRALARHAGTAFVRVPDGSAYEAVVQVKGMDTSGPGPVLAVSVDAQEVALAEDHMLPRTVSA